MIRFHSRNNTVVSGMWNEINFLRLCLLICNILQAYYNAHGLNGWQLFKVSTLKRLEFFSKLLFGVSFKSILMIIWMDIKKHQFFFITYNIIIIQYLVLTN